jgi:cytochrome c biogenesis protein CcdA
LPTSILLFGFLLGMKHALEADHVAAVASLATRSASLRDHVRLAGLWGVGHAITVVTVGSLVVVLGLALPPSLARALEGVVAVVLIALGVDVLRRLRASRVHIHVHRHDGGPPHLHAHSHAGELVHDPARHHHHHVHVRWRALAVGTVHGLAGSAALVLVAVAETRSISQAVGYLCVFALGSVLGMMALSVAISIPLRASARRLGRLHAGLEGVLGASTVVLGCWIAIQVLANR